MVEGSSSLSRGIPIASGDYSSLITQRSGEISIRTPRKFQRSIPFALGEPGCTCGSKNSRACLLGPTLWS